MLNNQVHSTGITKTMIFKEMLIDNFSFIFLIFITNAMQYADISIRLKAISPLVFLLLVVIFQRRIRLISHKVFPWLETLFAYKQSEGFSINNRKLKIINSVLAFILVVGIIYMALYPTPFTFQWPIFLGSIIGLNIGLLINNYKIYCT